jgi:hypothetical protein
MSAARPRLTSSCSYPTKVSFRVNNRDQDQPPFTPTRLGPSYFFIPLVLGRLNSLVWYVPSLRYTRGLGWRMHCSVEVTESSTNKQHHIIYLQGTFSPHSTRPSQPLLLHPHPTRMMQPRERAVAYAQLWGDVLGDY